MTCHRCQRKFRAGEPHVHSRLTGNNYCADMTRCDARAKRKGLLGKKEG